MSFNVPCKISRTFYKLAYFRLSSGLLVGYTYIVKVVTQVLSKLKIKRTSYKAAKVISQIIHFIFKKIEVRRVCEKNNYQSSFF